MFRPLQQCGFSDAALGLAFAVLLSGTVPEVAAQTGTFKSHSISFKSHSIRFKSHDIGFKSHGFTFKSHELTFKSHEITLKSYQVRLPKTDMAARVVEPDQQARSEPADQPTDEPDAPPKSKPQKPQKAKPAKKSAKAQKKRVRYRLSGDILFDFDKSDIRPEAQVILSDLAARIARNFKRARVLVEGHTDAKGADAYNQNLSERRAASVKRWFARKGGIRAHSISTRGYGEQRPVAANQNSDGSDNPVGRQQNRRVEIVVEGK